MVFIDEKMLIILLFYMNLEFCIDFYQWELGSFIQIWGKKLIDFSISVILIKKNAHTAHLIRGEKIILDMEKSSVLTFFFLIHMKN